MKEFSLKCKGCDYTPDFIHELVNGCRNQEESNANHILEMCLGKRKSLTFEDLSLSLNKSSNPYIVFKDFFLSNYAAKEHSVDYDCIVSEIQEGLRTVDSTDFRQTPLNFYEKFKGLKNGLFVKNETGNVGGSHKARHLMGNILYFEVLRKAGIINEKPRLSIYSCGNAAIAASVIAKAAGYKLDVFIPPNVEPKVTDILNRNNANVNVCPRQENETGDPCYNRFLESLREGAVSFSCSGPDNWANIEGGETLVYELMTQTHDMNKVLDSIVVQVGGGALASSAVHAFMNLKNNGLINKIPKIYTVQTSSCYPLARAYYLIVKKISDVYGIECSLSFIKKSEIKAAVAENLKILNYSNSFTSEIMRLSSFIKKNYNSEKIQEILSKACKEDKTKYMWAWETEPQSIAHGILDDFTYDWLMLIEGMFKTGGIPAIVHEDELEISNITGKNLTGINADYTGTSGLCGLVHLISQGAMLECDNSAVIFTGVER